MSSYRSVPVGYFEPTEVMVEEIANVVASGRISYGPQSRMLEKEIAKIHDVEYGVLSSSGTDSLRAALHAMMIKHDWKFGDEVIVPATTFVASVNVIEQVGLVPVLVDVEQDMYCIDPDSVYKALTSDTVAIMPVNLLGQPADLDAIYMIAFNEELAILEDSCEAMFVRHHGIPVGAWGDVGVFSFYMAHLITAGVGGIAVTDDKFLAATMRSLLNHGRSSEYISIDDDDNLVDEELAKVIRRRYAFKYQGYSSRITEMQAAMARMQLRDWEDMIARRQAVASVLTAGLCKHAGKLQLPVEREAGEHAYMMYGILVKDGSKWPLMMYLESHGVETREMLPIINQKVYELLVAESAKRGIGLSVSKKIIDGGFYIGCHQGMSDDDAEYVCHVVDDFFARN